MTRLKYRCRRCAAALAVVCLAFVSEVLADGPQYGPVHPGEAPWAIDYYDASWCGINDPVMLVGYNLAAGGYPFLPGEPSLALGFEANYCFTPGTNLMEFYLQYLDGLGSPYIRPLYFGFNRGTRKLESMFIGGSPTINLGDASNNNINAQIGTNNLTLFGVDPTQGTIISLKTTAGSHQPGVLKLGFDGTDNVLSLLPVSTTQAYIQINGTNGIHYYKSPQGGTPSGSIAVGNVDDYSAVGVFSSENASDNVKALVARGKYSMTQNVFEVQGQDHTAVHAVDQAGVVSMYPAPAPGQDPQVGVYLYVDALDNNNLKYKTPDGIVHTIVTSCAPACVVPNVLNVTQAAATSAIIGAGLVLGTVTTQTSATVAAGRVISESPAAGTTVANGSAVNLVISTGPVVPNVVNLTQAAATSLITAAGLVLGTVTMQTSATVAWGNVISESPAAGTSVPIGSAVSLVVSGPVCGNGIIETGEQCDDGNTLSGDGCSSSCQAEAVSCPCASEWEQAVPANDPRWQDPTAQDERYTSTDPVLTECEIDTGNSGPSSVALDVSGNTTAAPGARGTCSLASASVVSQQPIPTAAGFNACAKLLDSYVAALVARGISVQGSGTACPTLAP